MVHAIQRKSHFIIFIFLPSLNFIIFQMFGVCNYKFLLIIIEKSVQLKVEHLMDLAHLVLESVVFVSPCHIIQILS